MLKVSVRTLSAELIKEVVGQAGVLGVTNNGNLVGVIIAFTQKVLERLTTGAAAETAVAVQIAEADLASGSLPIGLEELQADDRDAPESLPDNSARRVRTSTVSIRELSGARLEQAAAQGSPVVITSDRVAVAVFMPIQEDWVDKLVEDSVARFLESPTARPALLPAESATQVGSVRPAAAATASRLVPAPSIPLHRRFSRLRAIGIGVVGSEAEGGQSLIGVTTNMLAEVVGEPVVFALENLSEGHLFDQITALVEGLRSQSGLDGEVVGIGIEVGGHVHNGRVIRSANAQWNHFPLAHRLHSQLGMPVVLENDANALAVYEHSFHGEDCDDFAVILITHRGVGCGLILEGDLYRGHRGMAGELGHAPLELGGSGERVKCRCLTTRCLEGVATPYAIQNALRESGLALSPNSPAHRADGATEQTGFAEVPDDQAVQVTFREAGASLGRGIATIINLLNPAAFVIYGPPDLVGRPRTFHPDRDYTAQAVRVEDLSNAATSYTNGMVEAVQRHAFSTGTEDVRFVIRAVAGDQGARAAAACLIRNVEIQSAYQRRHVARSVP